MKKQPTLLVAWFLTISSLSFTLALAKDASGKEDDIWTAPPEAARKSNPEQADEQTLSRGRELYTKQCLPCHGQAGKGDGPKAGDLKRKPGDLSKPGQQTDGELFWKITEGKTPMPSFDGKLSEKERWDIVNYVRTLGTKSDGAAPVRRDNASQGEQSNTGGKYVSREDYEKLKTELEALKAQFQEVLDKGTLPKGEKAALPKTGAEAPSRTELARWSIPRRAVERRNPVPADEQSFARGKEHYTAECLVCHGPNGKGDGSKARELGQSVSDLSSPEIRQQTDGELFWKTTEGKTPMPSFKPKFSDKQRWDIINYIRTFASKSEQTNRAGAGNLAQAQEAPKKEMTEKKDKEQSPKAVSEEPKKAEADQAQALDALRKEIKDVKQLAKESFPGSTKLLLTGYGSAGFTAQDHGGDNFFSTTFNPILLWKMSDRLLFEGELEAELEDHDTSIALEMAQLSYLLNDYMTIGAGKFLDPMNYFVERQHMAWVNKLPDKPLAVYDGLLPESNVGIQIRGGIPVGPTKFGYAFYVANAPELRVDTNSLSATDLGTLEFDNFQNIGKHIAFGGRLGFFPIPDLEIGYGIQFARVSPPGTPDRVNAFLHSVDLSYVNNSEVLKGIINLKAQWVWSRVGSFTYDPNGTVGGPFSFTNNREGGYVQLAYRPSRLTTRFIKDLEPVIRYDVLNQAKTQTGFDERRLTIGLNYWLGPSTVMKIAYELDHQNGPNADRHNAILLQFAMGF